MTINYFHLSDINLVHGNLVSSCSEESDGNEE